MDIEDIEDGCGTEKKGSVGGGRVIEGKKPESGGTVPTRAGKVFLEVFGCSHANSDGEYIGGLLAGAGYSFVSKMEEADICVIYGCTVKNPSEDSFLNRIIGGHKLGKKVVGCGCVSQADPENVLLPKEVALVGVRELGRIVEVVEKLEKGEVLHLVPRVAKRLSKAERRKLGRKGYHPGMLFFIFLPLLLFFLFIVIILFL